MSKITSGVSTSDLDQMIAPEAQVRIEALNLASRETVARAYDNKPTVEIATEMLAFISGNAGDGSETTTHRCGACGYVHLPPSHSNAQTQDAEQMGG